MPPDGSSFTALNMPSSSQLPVWMGSFSLHAPPNTDLWRKPPSRDTSTAPILYTALRHPFVAAEVTVSADWELEWDQGGLVIFAGAPPGRVFPPAVPVAPSSCIAGTSPVINLNPTDGTTTTPPPPPPYIHSQPAVKWVKAGLEFYGGIRHASSVVATPDGADWSLAPLSPAITAANPAINQQTFSDLRVKLERVGHALWIWFEDPIAGWKKLREVTWFFWGVEDKAVRVGVYASRPASFGVSHQSAGTRHAAGQDVVGASSRDQAGLAVEFEGLEIF